KAGRPAYKQDQIVIEDYLPSGFKLDLDQTVDANKDYVITFDEVTNYLKATLTDEGLAKLNQDLTKDFDLVDLILFGSPQNDNGVYKNTYSLLIGDYKVYSNTVTIYTPGSENPDNGGSTIQPIKKVQDLKGNDINNQTVDKGQKIVYVGEWDLDQYKDIAAGAVAIQKGFGYIDNYDETKVSLDLDNVTIKDSTGKAVEGLTAYVIKNLADAPEAIRKLVQDAGIEIGENDEFVIWVANDPQAFYDTYVKTGLDIFLEIPATVKKDVPGGEKIDNVMYQIDFGNGYVSNVVTNTVKEDPKPTPPVQPEAPRPQAPVAPAPQTAPVQAAAMLPSTGETTGLLSVIGAMMLVMLGWIRFGERKEN
uniref:SspB-related isopeptide-forming adhesin n=1 Tax=Streptococcus ovis TaxID=82806 RepID=UPI000477D1BB